MLPGGPPPGTGGCGGGLCLLRWLGLRLWSRRGTMVFALLWFGSWLFLNGLVLVHRRILSDYCTDDKSKRILQRLVSPDPVSVSKISAVDQQMLRKHEFSGGHVGEGRAVAILGRAGLTGIMQDCRSKGQTGLGFSGPGISSLTQSPVPVKTWGGGSGSTGSDGPMLSAAPVLIRFCFFINQNQNSSLKVYLDMKQNHVWTQTSSLFWTLFSVS